jgi:hypothetical protein
VKYFSEKEQGDRPRTQDQLSELVWRGLRTEIVARINDGSFGARYPEMCPDGQGPIGTDERALSDAMRARIPTLPAQPWLRGVDEAPSVHDVMDLIEFCWRSIGKPARGGVHSYFGHYHLSFDIEEGQDEFADAINDIFRRNGLAYELSEEGSIQRLAPPVLQEALSGATFASGDSGLDQLLEDARRKFLKPDEQVRREALEKLWDAFERIKTLEAGTNKNAQAKALLDIAAGWQSPKFREALETEARELTRIGNTLHIRHSETTQEPLANAQQVDYLFQRLFALITLLLRASGRM